MSDLRKQILESADLSHEDVKIPEWGVTIRVVSPTVRERARIVSAFMGPDGKPDLEAMYPALVIATATDPKTGERLFTDADAEALAGKNGRAMERAAKAAMTVAGMNDDTIDVGKDA